jgi:hypothetical protein
MNNTFTQPRWMPIGQYRTCSLPILPIPPPMKRIVYNKPEAKVNNITGSINTTNNIKNKATS